MGAAPSLRDEICASSKAVNPAAKARGHPSVHEAQEWIDYPGTVRQPAREWRCDRSSMRESSALMQTASWHCPTARAAGSGCGPEARTRGARRRRIRCRRTLQPALRSPSTSWASRSDRVETGPSYAAARHGPPTGTRSNQPLAPRALIARGQLGGCAASSTQWPGAQVWENRRRAQPSRCVPRVHRGASSVRTFALMTP